MDADLIIREMLKTAKMPNQKALSKYFNISEPYITKWKKNNSIPSEFIYKFDNDYGTNLKQLQDSYQKQLEEAKNTIMKEYNQSIEKVKEQLNIPFKDHLDSLQKKQKENIKKILDEFENEKHKSSHYTAHFIPQTDTSTPAPSQTSLTQSLSNSYDSIKADEALLTNFKLLSDKDRERILDEIISLASKRLKEVYKK